jgi:hypothetical protein
MTISNPNPNTSVNNTSVSSSNTSTSKEQRLQESIQWFSRHIPQCILPTLLLFQQHNKLTLPYISSTHDAALLFVDISGFTELSTLLDVEHFSQVSSALYPVRYGT